MEKWPVGVFTSIDAGLGVDLSVAKEIGIPTVQIHAPHQGNRTAKHAEEILARLAEFGITVTAVFGGFEGESYADIPTVVKTVGLVPPETRPQRLAEMKEISDFSKLKKSSTPSSSRSMKPKIRQPDLLLRTSQVSSSEISLPFSTSVMTHST